MAVDSIALKSELTQDPAALGYQALIDSGQTDLLAAELNKARSSIMVSRDVVQAYEVFEALAPSEWASLTAANITRLQAMLAMGEIKLSGPNTRQALQDICLLATNSKTAITTLLTRPGSRAEQLFGTGKVVLGEDVVTAIGAK